MPIGTNIPSFFRAMMQSLLTAVVSGPQHSVNLSRVMSTNFWRKSYSSKRRSWPFGSEAWLYQTVVNLNLERTMRSEGRPGQAPTEV